MRGPRAPSTAPTPYRTLDDIEERAGIKARPSDQETVEVRPGEQVRGVVRLDRPAVEDPQVAGRVGAEALRHRRPQQGVRLLGQIGGRGPPGADGPDRLVGEGPGPAAGGRQRRGSCARSTVSVRPASRSAAVSPTQSRGTSPRRWACATLAATGRRSRRAPPAARCDRTGPSSRPSRSSGAPRRRRCARRHPRDGGPGHPRRSTTREPLRHHRQEAERRKQDDLHGRRVRQVAPQTIGVGLGVGAPQVHLPVGREERAPLRHVVPGSRSASTPGSFRPARSSSAAPPPVDVVDPVRDPGLRRRRDRFAAADHGVAAVSGERAGHAAAALVERRRFEQPDRPVPERGARRAIAASNAARVRGPRSTAIESSATASTDVVSMRRAGAVPRRDRCDRSTPRRWATGPRPRGRRRRRGASRRARPRLAPPATFRASSRARAGRCSPSRRPGEARRGGAAGSRWSRSCP